MSGKRSFRLLSGIGLILILALVLACTETVEVPGETVIKEVVKTVEVPGETVIKEVVKTVEVPGQTVIKEVVKTVEVPGQTVIVEKEVVKEVIVEVPVVVEKEVVKVVIEEKLVEVPVAVERRSGPTYGGTLRIATGADAGSLGDMCQFRGERPMGFYAENLTMYDWARGVSGTGETNFFARMGAGSDLFDKGAVADRWDLPDPLSYRFHIREGITFQDKNPTFGRKVTTEDVVQVMDRMVECRWPRHNFLDQDVPVTGVDTDDDGVLDSIVFHTVKPVAFWAYEFAHGPYFKVTPPESIEAGLDNWENLSGTGPFILADYVPASKFEFERNPNYYGTYTVDGREWQVPFIDKVIDIIIPQQATRIAAMRTGKIDTIEGVIPVEREGLEKTNPELLKTGPLERPFAWYMPMNKPPFDDVKVRYAMNMAIDRDAVTEIMLGGNASVMSYPFGPEQAAFFEPLENMPDVVQAYFKYDPAMAEQLLDEAGLMRDSNGTRFEIDLMISSSNETLIEATEIAIAFWDDIGVEVTMDLTEPTQWTSRLFANEYDFSATVAAPASNTMQNFKEGHQWNQSNMNDATFLAMYDEVESTTDSALLISRQKATAAHFLSLAPGIIMPAGFGADYWYPWVQNFAGQRALGHYEVGTRWSYIWLDRDLRYDSTGFKD